jgi:hypothetical protein
VEPGTPQASIEKQQIKDCVRTFTEFKAFTEPWNSGNNRLFNVLKAYSLFDPELGYTQGLNFVAAMILLVVEDESIAFLIFIKLLEKNEWRRFYTNETPKLFEMTKLIKKYLEKHAPKVLKKIKKSKILLEPLIASAFITLFSNTIDVPNATKVMERFMLIGERYIVDTICLVIVRNEGEILKMTDEFMLQKLLGRTMYQTALENGTFFIQNKE